MANASPQHIVNSSVHKRGPPGREATDPQEQSPFKRPRGGTAHM